MTFQERYDRARRLEDLLLTTGSACGASGDYKLEDDKLGCVLWRNGTIKEECYSRGAAVGRASELEFRFLATI